MCTVSWCNRPDGYTLFFNRDESRDRALAMPPSIGSSASTHYICPKDPQGGGTWLLVNEHGLTIGLLNYYEAATSYQPIDPKSRGALPLRFSECTTLAGAKSAALKEDFKPYPPLHLLVVDSTGSALLMTWDGRQKYISYPTTDDLPISTSAFKADEVVLARKAQLKTVLESQKNHLTALETFHSSELPLPTAHAVLMTRPDAKTVSICRVDVRKQLVSMGYRSRLSDDTTLESPALKSIVRSS